VPFKDEDLRQEGQVLIAPDAE